MPSLLDEVKTHRKNIKYETLTFSLAELVRMHEDGEMVIRPNFQRLFRWNRTQQSTFVESLILEIPIPPLYFFETDEGAWELLDGLQRISTTIKFFAAGKDVPGEFQGEAHNDDDWHTAHQNDIDAPLQLIECEYLTSLKGLTFSRLPAALQLNLKRTRLQVSVLKRETHKDYKYEVFNRLNSGGAHLSDQELRNCAARLVGDEFPQFLQDLGEKEYFRAAVELSDSQTREGFGEELVLRYFAMKNYPGGFARDVSEFLTKYMKEVTRNAITFDYEGEKQLFERVFTLLSKAGAGGIFRARTPKGARTGPFSPALFELRAAISVAKNIDNAEKSADLAEQLDKLTAEARKRDLTGGGSNSTKKTRGRLELAATWFES